MGSLESMHRTPSISPISSQNKRKRGFNFVEPLWYGRSWPWSQSERGKSNLEWKKNTFILSNYNELVDFLSSGMETSCEEWLPLLVSQALQVFQRLFIESLWPALEHVIIRLEADTSGSKGHRVGKAGSHLCPRQEKSDWAFWSCSWRSRTQHSPCPYSETVPMSAACMQQSGSGTWMLCLQSGPMWFWTPHSNPTRWHVWKIFCSTHPVRIYADDWKETMFISPRIYQRAISPCCMPLPRTLCFLALKSSDVWKITGSLTMPTRLQKASRKGKADREMTMSLRLRVPNAVSATICLQLCTSRFLHNKAIKSLRISLWWVRIAFAAGNRSEMKPGNEMNKTIAYQQFSRRISGLGCTNF